MSFEEAPLHGRPSWREIASAWIVSACLVAGLVIGTEMNEEAGYTAASHGGQIAPVIIGIKALTGHRRQLERSRIVR